MNNLVKVAKYQLYDFKKAVGIYYLIIFAISLLLVLASDSVRIGGNAGFSGVTIVFVFITGLNCFKSSFKYLQANNVSRRSFYSGTIIAITGLSLFMAVIDLLVTKMLINTVPYEGLYQQIYSNNAFLAELVWSFVSFLLATSLGWFITMIYYRSNTLMKTVVSISPALLITLITYLSKLTNGALGTAIGTFCSTALGFSDKLDPNPYMAALSFIVGTIGVLALSFLLIKKAPIKD